MIRRVKQGSTTAMDDHGYNSPAEAATAGFPDNHCRSLASQIYMDDAYVLLDTGVPGAPYLYGADCVRIDGRWFELGSSNGSGWHQSGDDPQTGTLSLWDEVPEDVEAVRVMFNGVPSEHPANHRAYLAVWWHVPVPTEWPKVVALKILGEWRPSSPGP
jgi:hypothetical protein